MPALRRRGVGRGAPVSALQAPVMTACPFCGGEAIEAQGFLERSQWKVYRAKCKTCGAGGPTSAGAEEALRKWNQRNQPRGETNANTESQ
jgi:Lar family restriction alleviation protein